MSKGGELKPFNPNSYQQELNKAASSKGMQRMLVLKCRQIGISTWGASYVYHKTATQFNKNALIIADDDENSGGLFRMTKLFYENSTPLVRPMQRYSNEKAIEFNHPDKTNNSGLNSKISVTTAGKLSAGRSKTIQYLHCSEFAYWPNAALVSTGLFQSVPLMDNTSILIESTANGVGGKGAQFYEMCMRSIDGDGAYKFFFFDWKENPDYEMEPGEDFKPDEEEKELMAKYPNLTLRKVAFRRYKIRNEMGSTVLDPRDQFKQEYPNNPTESFIASGRPCFNTEQIHKDIASAPEGERYTYKSGGFEKDSRGEFLVFKKPENRAYSIGCLPDGEEVLTDAGPMPIEEVTFSEKLYGKDGSMVEIINRQRKHYEGKLYKVKPNYTVDTTTFTGEHPILVLADTKLYRDSKTKVRFYKEDVTWKKAEELTGDDILRFPVIYKKELSNQEILNRFPSQESVRPDKLVSKEMILNEDFWFFVGFWLAEGWIRNKGNNEKLKEVTVAVGTNKGFKTLEKVAAIIRNVIGRIPSRRTRGHCTELKFSCFAVYEFLSNNFGQGALDKDISEWVKFLPKNLKIRLFEGYISGDGCIISSKSGPVINAVSISKKLLNDFQDILLSLKALAAVKVLREAGEVSFRGKLYKTKKTYELNISSRDSHEILTMMGWPAPCEFKRAKHKRYGWLTSDYLYLKISKIEEFEFSGYVNNFETSDHSYCSRLITTHNCDVAEGLETGDFSTACVINKDLEVCCTYSGHIDPDQFGEILVKLAKWYNGAIITHESNNHGHSVSNTLKRIGYNKLWKREVLDELGKDIQDKIGWNTNVKTKMLMLDELIAPYRDGLLKVNCKQTLREMLTIMIEDGGGVVLNGKDRTVALGLSIQGLKQSSVENSLKAYVPTKSFKKDVTKMSIEEKMAYYKKGGV